MQAAANVVCELGNGLKNTNFSKKLDAFGCIDSESLNLTPNRVADR